MAVTVTPENIDKSGRNRALLTRTAGQDPTHVEVPNPPVMIIFRTGAAGTLSFDITPQNSAERVGYNPGAGFDLPATEAEAGKPYVITIREWFADWIIDTSTTPNQVTFTGGDLTNGSFLAFTMNLNVF